MKKVVQQAKVLFKTVIDIFDDWLTRAAGIVVVLIIAIVIYNMGSNLTETIPILGALVYAMVPVLFIVGGIIFVMAILKFSKPETVDSNKPAAPVKSPKVGEKSSEPSKSVAINNGIGVIVSENE